jgi:hypothetical protein
VYFLVKADLRVKIVTPIMFLEDRFMQYYTTRQVAELFGVRPITVRRWIGSGDLIVVNPKSEGGSKACQQFVIQGGSVEKLAEARGVSLSSLLPWDSGLRA